MSFQGAYPLLYQTLEDFSVGRLDLTLEALDRIDFRNSETIGYAWRDSFATALKALKRQECFYKWESPLQECGQCDHQQCPACIYRYYDKAFDKPKPFIFSPDNGKTMYEPGDTMKLSLYLAGSALDEAPMFVNGITELGHSGRWKGWKGRFTVAGVAEGDFLRFGDIACDRISEMLFLEILTPMKLDADKTGIQYAGLDAGLFARLLINRVVNLNFLYGRGHEADKEQVRLEKERLLAVARGLQVKGHTVWTEENRFSRNQGSMKVGGIGGLVMLSGNLSALYPFLKAGEMLGVGSNTVSGYGRYRLHRATAA